MKSESQAYLDLLSVALKTPNLYVDLDEQFEMVLETTQISTDLRSSRKQCKNKKRKPPLFYNKVKNAISAKRQALKPFGRTSSASNKTRLQSTTFTDKEAKCNHFPNVFLISMNKPKKIYETLNEVTGKRSVKTNQKNNIGIKDTIKACKVIGWTRNLLTVQLLLNVQAQLRFENVIKFLMKVMTICLPF